MKIFKVIGNITLSRSHPTYRGARLVVAEPTEAAALGGPQPVDPDMVVVWDELGAGLGAQIAVSDGGEAALPFRPDLKAVDAYCSAILDTIFIDPNVVKQLNLK